MPFASIVSTTRLAATASLFAMLTFACWGQEPPSAPTPTPQNTPEARPLPVLDYAKPVSHFPNPIGPYTARHVAEPNLANTARLDQLMHEGKLYLSLDDAVALALENNLDIAIQRYNLNIADTDVLRAKSGANIFGVNAGVVLNTPGGGVGGIGANSGAATGGTSLGAGGAGGGTNGLVSSTLGFGPVLNSYDPILSGTFQEDHFSQQATSIFQGVLPGTSLAQNTGTVNFAYQQAFQWGTNLQLVSPTRADHQQLFLQLESAIEQRLQGDGHPASFARIWVCPQHPIHPHRQEQSRTQRRGIPSSESPTRSIRSKTSTGISSSPMKMRECRTSRSRSPRRLSPTPRNRWKSEALPRLKSCAHRAPSPRTSNW